MTPGRPPKPPAFEHVDAIARWLYAVTERLSAPRAIDPAGGLYGRRPAPRCLRCNARRDRLDGTPATRTALRDPNLLDRPRNHGVVDACVVCGTPWSLEPVALQLTPIRPLKDFRNNRPHIRETRTPRADPHALRLRRADLSKFIEAPPPDFTAARWRAYLVAWMMRANHAGDPSTRNLSLATLADRCRDRLPGAPIAWTAATLRRVIPTTREILYKRARRCSPPLVPADSTRETRGRN